MKLGPSETFTQKKNKEEYLQIEKLPILDIHRALFREQYLKNDPVLGFGDHFLLLLACLYENIHYTELLKDSWTAFCGKLVSLGWKSFNKCS